MQNHERKRTKRAADCEQVGGQPSGSPNLDNPANSPTGYTPVTNTDVNRNNRERPEWRDAGRAACRAGRKLEANPWGIVGLTVEGLIRQENWVIGWNAEAMRAAGIAGSA